ncbi:MAG: hypothetical protein WBD36_13820 [Bacteroidota bacterium]
MKRITLIAVAAGLLLAHAGCSADKADPQFRIRNERADKANVQLQTTGGNAININDVLSGQITSYQSTFEGTIVATAVIQNESVSPTATFFAAKDTRSTVVVLAGNPPSLRIDQ